MIRKLALTCAGLCFVAFSSQAISAGLLPAEPGASAFTTVQYGSSCSTWRRECARLYGGGSYEWQQCMNQPKALRDCSRGGYQGDNDGRRQGSGYDTGPRPGACANWRRQCSNLYGFQSQQWYQCMGQPKAVRDCR